jgi:mono/diheme cytochrome c family protein
MIDRYVSPSELRRLLSALLVVAVFIALLAVFAFLIIPGIRNANRPVTGPGMVPGGPLLPRAGNSGWLDPTDYPPERGRILPPVDPATVMTPNPALLERGRALFASTCTSCHGPKGEGDGAAGKGLTPPPRNFTRKDGWKNGTRVDAIFKTLEEGVKGSSMVSYAYLSRKDRMALVHYVRSMGSFDHGPENPEALAALAKLFASSGEVVPNRIPVAMAMGRLAQEYRRPAPLDRKQEPILGEAVADPARAAQTLALLPDWRASDKALAAGVVPGIPGNGFRPGVARFTPGQWQTLRGALVRAVKEVSQ